MKTLLTMLLFPVCLALAEVAPETAESYILVKQDATQKDSFLNQFAASLQKAKVIYLATTDGKSARVRPLRYTAVIDNRLIFATSSKKELFLQILRNPEVEASATQRDESAFMRYKGKAVVCEDSAIRTAFLRRFPKFLSMYGETLRLVAIEPEMAGIFPMKKGCKPVTKTFTK